METINKAFFPSFWEFPEILGRGKMSLTGICSRHNLFLKSTRHFLRIGPLNVKRNESWFGCQSSDRRAEEVNLHLVIKIDKMKVKAFIASLVLGLITLSVVAQDASALRKKEYNLEDNVAISGYDPVSYFFLNKAVKGKKELNYTYQGVVYRFSNGASLEEFKKNPSKYEPAYGGWCAYAMGSKGEKVTIDPQTFKIINGKLYLFYNSFFNNTLKSWNKDETVLKTKADVNWKKIYH
jgi:YHS domain-containing protein